MARERSSFKMGTVEMMALFILSKGDFYGYQIASLIGKLTDGKVTVPESTLYPTLYKLLDRKLISDKTVPLGRNRVRVFYHLEEEGWQRLNEKDFQAEKLYYISISIAKSMFQKGVIDEEVLAVAACAIGRINRWHNAARLAFFTALSGLFWYGFAWLSEKEFFYRALNIEPALAMPEGTVNPALLFIILLTVVPVVLYPAVFFIHGFTRMLDYDEDAYAVTHVGAKPLARALAKLHRDYRRSLTPNRFYSLANHRRPHVTQRIEAALLTEKRDRRHTANAAVDEKRARAALYNAVLAKRREERNERLALRVQLKSTTKSIKEIARDMNFPNQSFLGKYFKEHVGMSPLSYRKS